MQPCPQIDIDILTHRVLRAIQSQRVDNPGVLTARVAGKIGRDGRISTLHPHAFQCGI